MAYFYGWILIRFQHLDSFFFPFSICTLIIFIHLWPFRRYISWFRYYVLLVCAVLRDLVYTRRSGALYNDACASPPQLCPQGLGGQVRLHDVQIGLHEVKQADIRSTRPRWGQVDLRQERLVPPAAWSTGFASPHHKRPPQRPLARMTWQDMGPWPDPSPGLGGSRTVTWSLTGSGYQVKSVALEATARLENIFFSCLHLDTSAARFFVEYGCVWQITLRNLRISQSNLSVVEGDLWYKNKTI